MNILQKQKQLCAEAVRKLLEDQGMNITSQEVYDACMSVEDAEETLVFYPIFSDAKYDPAGNWKEDFPHENGNYSNRCTECGGIFLGHKRRVICRLCVTSASENTD